MAPAPSVSELQDGKAPCDRNSGRDPSASRWLSPGLPRNRPGSAHPLSLAYLGRDPRRREEGVKSVQGGDRATADSVLKQVTSEAAGAWPPSPGGCWGPGQSTALSVPSRGAVGHLLHPCLSGGRFWAPTLWHFGFVWLGPETASVHRDSRDTFLGVPHGGAGGPLVCCR